MALLPPPERGSEKPILMSWLPSRLSRTRESPSARCSSPVEREGYFVPLPMADASLPRVSSSTTSPPVSSTCSATRSNSLPSLLIRFRNSSSILILAFDIFRASFSHCLRRLGWDDALLGRSRGGGLGLGAVGGGLGRLFGHGLGCRRGGGGRAVIVLLRLRVGDDAVVVAFVFGKSQRCRPPCREAQTSAFGKSRTAALALRTCLAPAPRAGRSS